jgi:hypothetical protein
MAVVRSPSIPGRCHCSLPYFEVCLHSSRQHMWHSTVTSACTQPSGLAVKHVCVICESSMHNDQPAWHSLSTLSQWSSNSSLALATFSAAAATAAAAAACLFSAPPLTTTSSHRRSYQMVTSSKGACGWGVGRCRQRHLWLPLRYHESAAAGQHRRQLYGGVLLAHLAQ